MMPLSKAKRNADARHIDKLDVIKLQPYKDDGQRIRQAASNGGQSLQGYILDAVRQKMQSEK
jgi:uncharacterized protein (DUF1778 family)